MQVLNSLRNLIRVSLWSLLLLLSLAITVAVVLCNYLGTSQAFQYLNTERMPLMADPLFGPALAGVGEATLGELLAAAVALSMAFGIFLAGHLLFGLRNQIRDVIAAHAKAVSARTAAQNAAAAQTPQERQAWEAEEAVWVETERVHIARSVMAAVAIVAIATALLYIVRWDAALFNFRSVVAGLNLATPAEAVQKAPTWTIAAREHIDKAWYEVGAVGYAGYLGATALAALGTEVAVMKMDESVEVLISTLQGAAMGEAEQHGPESEPAEPRIATNGQLGIGTSTHHQADENAVEHAPPTPTNPAVEHSGVFARMGEVAECADGGVDGDAPRDEAPSTTVEVIGEPGVKVTRAQAASDGKYHIAANGDVWLRSYWSELHGESQVA